MPGVRALHYIKHACMRSVAKTMAARFIPWGHAHALTSARSLCGPPCCMVLQRQQTATEVHAWECMPRHVATALRRDSALRGDRPSHHRAGGTHV